MRGIFITLEGLDGSGKTTQIELLEWRLRQQRIPYVVAREPGGTASGDAIRAILLSSRTVGLDPRTEALLYFASRAQNVSEVILPALKAGRVVLCDRFVDSSRAYQGAGRKLGGRTIDDLERIACQGLKPRLTLLLDIAQKHGVKRATSRNTEAARDESRIERESHAFFSRVRKEYLAIAKREPRRVKMVDGNRSVEEIHNEIWKHVWALSASLATRKRSRR